MPPETHPFVKDPDDIEFFQNQEKSQFWKKLNFNLTLILLQRNPENLHSIEDFQSNFFISLKIL